jgi:CelD/BcsL family acetyltransferase involved in cellulose biosynthesis
VPHLRKIEGQLGTPHHRFDTGARVRIAEIPITDPAWAEFVHAHPGSTPFHLPEWASLIADCYNFPTFALVIRDTDGEILAGMPVVAARSPLGGLRWVSLPYSDTCEMLVRAGTDEDAVIERVRAHVLGGPAKELEVRSELPPGADVHTVTVGYDHVVDLPEDPANLRPRKSHRHCRNRASRIGVRVDRGVSAEHVATFYRLHTLTRRRHGVPVQPRRFFEMLGERLITLGRGFVSIAVYEGQPVAAALFIGHNGTLVAKYGASDPDHSDLGAGHLIDWDSMVAGCLEGYRRLDLGRTDLGADGLRHYKVSWGAVEHPLSYSHVSSKPPMSPGVPHTGGLSQKIIQRSPLWVCRGLGEAFYRWSA